VRDDSFDADIAGVEQRRGKLIRELGREIGEEVQQIGHRLLVALVFCHIVRIQVLILRWIVPLDVVGCNDRR
jgi:hypothetical protein